MIARGGAQRGVPYSWGGGAINGPSAGVDQDAGGQAHVWRRYRFQAAHQLPHVPLGHKCGRMHGHGFEVIVHANQDLGERDRVVTNGPDPRTNPIPQD